MVALINIISYLLWIFITLVLVQLVIGLLAQFEVLDRRRHQIAFQVHNSIDRLLAPILQPIRKILPDTGAIDFSPLVVIVLGQVLIMALAGAL